MLGNFEDHRRIYVEVTKAEHEHGGPGWEFGTCLWSPQLTKSGGDLYHLLRTATPGDLILHILEDHWGPGDLAHRWVGRSYVRDFVDEVEEEPPLAGNWANQGPYYRLPLRGYQAFPEPISLSAFLNLYDKEMRTELASKPRLFPFIFYNDERELRLRQGGYINECTPSLFELVRQAIGENPKPVGEPKTPEFVPPVSAETEYRETKRLASERYAFARNPALVRDAKFHRGVRCEACDFVFSEKYGEILEGDYIECHHIVPLGARNDPTTTTTIHDVRMLCANCHRMVHRSNPPLPAEELREILGLAPLELDLKLN